jgi:hypothetical protein
MPGYGQGYRTVILPLADAHNKRIGELIGETTRKGPALLFLVGRRGAGSSNVSLQRNRLSFQLIGEIIQLGSGLVIPYAAAEPACVSGHVPQ